MIAGRRSEQGDDCVETNSGELQPTTEAGKRFVAIVAQHRDTFRERAPAHDEAASFPAENIDDLKASGGMAVFVPEELGGLGLASIHDWIVGLERMARADASTTIAVTMHYGVTRNLAGAWRAAVERGDEAAAQGPAGMLRAIAAGELVFCATATEAGTDFLRPQTTAEASAEGWSINGRKFFVTMSPIANLAVVGLRVREAGEDDKIGFAFIPMETPGLLPQDDWDALGMRASGSQSVVFEDCRVPRESIQIAGEWGRWNPGILMGRTIGNVTLVGVFLGIAERARELALAGAQAATKTKLDGALASASGVQHLLGEIDIELAAARAVLGEAARRLDTALAEPGGGRPSLEVAHGHMRDYQAAKWTVNQRAIRIVSRAMDVQGGTAFMGHNELSRLYRDVRAGPFMQPFSPTETHEYVGQVALGLYPEG